MTDPRTTKLADVLVNYSTKVKKNDWVVVWGNIAAEPLVEEVVKFAVRAGGNVNTLLGSETVSAVATKESSKEQLEWVSPFEEMRFTKADVLVRIRGGRNSRSMSGVDPEKQLISGAARSDLMKIYQNRSASKDLRWVITQFPTYAGAQEADMGLREFEDFVYRATFADKDDPVKEWKKVHDEQQHWVDWLKGKKQVEVRGKHAEISLSIEDRTFRNSDGDRNMPSGEIFTSPVEDSCNGWVEFTYPAVRMGREVKGVRLEFKDGKVVQASAEKGEDYLLTMLDMDEGARTLGEFAIGTNYGIDRFTKSILYDEKIGGSFHIAVGRGFPELGGKNESSLHWDFICDVREDSEILVDGELLYKDGQFQV
jgi:aminopeptidase